MNRVATRCRDHGRWWWWTAFLLLSCGALALLTMTAPRTADAQGLAVAAPAGPQGKEPVPKAADLRKALTLAREIFEADYAQAKTPAQKSELARKLIDQADKAPGDPAAQFVLLRVARDIAAEAGEAEVACVCIDSTGAKFAIDVATLKIETLVRISQTATSAAQHGALARQCLPLIGQLVDQHRIDEAARLSPPALAAAQKAPDGALLRQVREVARTVEAAVAVQAAARDALTVLQQDPEDADAHLVVGKYYCFVRGGWTAGLAHLSRSSDPGLSAVAQAEIAGAQTGAQKTALGDTWWDLAQNSDDADRPLLLARARHWYQLAQPELQGLARVKIEKRLAELAALPIGKPAQITTWTEPPPPDTGLVRLIEPAQTAITSVCFSPDGRYALSGGNDATIRLWDIHTGREIRRFEGHTGPVADVDFNSDGTKFLSGGADKTARLWDVQSGRQLQLFPAHAGGVTRVRIAHPNDKYCLTYTSHDNLVRVWEMATAQEVKQFKITANAHTYLVALSGDGRFALSGAFANTAKLWNTTSGEALAFDSGGHSYGGALSSDGRFAMTVSGNGARLWDLSTSRLIHYFSDRRKYYRAAISPDVRQGATSAPSGEILLWDLRTGELLKYFSGHTKAIGQMVFSPSGRYLLSGSHDGTLRLWGVPK